MPDYSKEHGTTFIDVKTGEGKHTYRDFGLYPSEVNMPDPPDVQKNFIQVPGMNGSLDVTEALDGRVHYEDREYSQKYLDLNGRPNMHARYSALQNYIHGKHMRMILDDDPEYYYEGRFEIGDPGPNNHKNTLQIKATLKPFKYSVYTTLEDWLWDPFSFEDGVIREYRNLQIENNTDIVIVGSEMPVVPVIIVESENGDGMDLLYKGTLYHLQDGRNRIVTMTLDASEQTFRFTGLGIVSVEFREGSL
jgi:phage-related protein